MEAEKHFNSRKVRYLGALTPLDALSANISGTCKSRNVNGAALMRRPLFIYSGKGEDLEVHESHCQLTQGHELDGQNGGNGKKGAFQFRRPKIPEPLTTIFWPESETLEGKEPFQFPKYRLSDPSATFPSKSTYFPKTDQSVTRHRTCRRKAVGQATIHSFIEGVSLA